MSVEQPGCPPSDRVVVGVDGSERSQQALRWARPLAAAMGATVEVVAVVPPSPPRSYGDTDWVTAVPGDFDPDTHGHRVLTDTLEAAFGGQSPRNCGAWVRQGNPAKVLLESALAPACWSWAPAAAGASLDAPRLGQHRLHRARHLPGPRRARQ